MNEEIKKTEVQENFNKVLEEESVKQSTIKNQSENITLTPEQRIKLCADEINYVLKKYGCVAEVQNQTVVRALPSQQKVEQDKKLETK